MSLKRYFSLIFLFCSVLGFAQTGTLRIFGTVKNTDNNPVPGWTVTIYGDPSSRVVKLVTDRNGDYEHKIALQAATVKAIQIEVTDPCSKTPLVQRAEAKPGEERHDFVICSQSNPGGGDPCEGKFSFTVRPDGWVEFHATSGSREAKYYWDFGDGSTGEGRDIKHQYQNEGVYVVVLTIGTTTCKFVYRAKIEVKGTVPPPDPRKSSWTNSCCGRVNITGLRASTSASPNNFVFTAGADFDIKEVSWDFGDSETATGNPVKHSYANPGKYLVTTTITGEFCKVELKTWIHVGNVVNPPPTPCDIDFNWKADNLTIKVVPDFKGATPDKLSWDFGDGSTSSDEIATHTYAKAGSYTVTLYVSINGVTCKISKEIRVGGRVSPPNPVSIEIYDVSPNPAGDDIMVSIKSNIAAGTTLVIADLRSNYLLKQAVNVEIGDNKAPFDISSLQAGFYLVYLYYDNQIVSRAKFQKI